VIDAWQMLPFVAPSTGSARQRRGHRVWLLLFCPAIAARPQAAPALQSPTPPLPPDPHSITSCLLYFYVQNA
jgi:hypothetical protein